LDVWTLQKEDVLTPYFVRLGLFLEALAEDDLERHDWTRFLAFEKVQSLFVFEEKPRMHENFRHAVIAKSLLRRSLQQLHSNKFTLFTKSTAYFDILVR
jgi:hypothetical protein